MTDLYSEWRDFYAEPVKCIGCEGNPAPENNPCAVCGKEAEPVKVPSDVQADAQIAQLLEEIERLERLAEALTERVRELEALLAAAQQGRQTVIAHLVEALERIASWPDGGNQYGQVNIKTYAAEALAAYRKKEAA